MKRNKLFVPVVLGMFAGHVFAAMDMPFSVVNTLRFGYDDNVYRDADEKESFFVHDIVDMAFEASLSERTDVMMKSRIHLKSERRTTVYPNLYALLNHSVSPRLLLRLSDKFTSGEKTGQVTTTNPEKRQDYYENTVSLVSSYVIDMKNRIDLSLSHEIERNDDPNDEFYDRTSKSVTLAWNRELRPQTTRLSLAAQYMDLEYDEKHGGFDSSTLYGELGHTFSPEWQGTFKGGMTKIDRTLTDRTTSDSTQPVVGVGLVYSPSPRTQFSGNYDYLYSDTDNRNYVGYTQQKISFGIQHDLTAKLMAKATAKFINDKYEDDDAQPGTTQDNNEDGMELALRLTYKLNRINFLEFGVRHTEKDRDVGTDWEQNIVDVGWRVEL